MKGRGPMGAWRRSVFWRVAGVLVGVQVVTVLLAVGLSAYLALQRSRDLAASSIRLQLDVIAEEIESRGFIEGDTLSVSPSLRLDLARRFPDPVYLLDPFGRVVLPDTTVRVPDDALTAMLEGEVALVVGEGDATWGIAPFYSPIGELEGGLFVQPLDATLQQVLSATRGAYVRALWIVIGVAVGMALLLGAFFTGQLVYPLRRVTRQIERIGAGEYGERLPVTREDEIGRLSAALNQMAEAVEASVERLRQTDRLRRELVANIGHDLRTPLAAFLGYVEEAERLFRLDRRDEAEDALKAAHRQGQYVQRLVSDLFELSLLDSARPPLRREPVPLGELLSEAARTQRTAMRDAGLTFVVDVPEALPIIQADGLRLLRVLDNLLSNARRHTEAGGTVALRAEARTDAVEMVVEDTGTGIAEAQQAQIFERYYRGEDARTRQQSGTGLGLAISRAIARAHGGEIEVESAPGVGSRFTFRLPLTSEETEERTPG